MPQPAANTSDPKSDLSDRWLTWPRWAVVVVLAVAVFLLQSLTGPYKDLRQQTAISWPPETHLGFGSGPLASYTDSLASLPTDGIALYCRAQLWDLLVPILLGAAFVLLFVLLVRTPGFTKEWLRWLALVPLVYVVFDLAEDLGLIALLSAYSPESELIRAIPKLTTVKLIALMGSFPAALVGLFVVKPWKQRSKPNADSDAA